MLVSITASILFLCSPGWEWYHRTVLAVSYLRVFAFFSVFESSNFISRIIRTCSYKIGLVLAVFLSVLYSLSVIAMRMYGTTLTSYNTDPILAETAWYAKRMQLNFDSFENALLTLFFCCVAGSWETFLAVTSVVFENPTVPPLFSSSLSISIFFLLSSARSFALLSACAFTASQTLMITNLTNRAKLTALTLTSGALLLLDRVPSAGGDDPVPHAHRFFHPDLHASMGVSRPLLTPPLAYLTLSLACSCARAFSVFFYTRE
jgi:hypothetical protein